MHTYSPHVSFTITPVADGVDEWTVSVMMSKRATSIADFLASTVRLNVSMIRFSVIGALLISKALLLARRLKCDEQRVLPLEYDLLCGLSIVQSFCTALC